MCNFPEVARDPVVDVLIGQDHTDLRYSRCDVKGQSGEPVTRFERLGWSCIGSLEKKENSSNPRTNLAYTFFTRLQVFDEIDHSWKRFWEVDSMGTQPLSKVMTGVEKLALNKVRLSLENDGDDIKWLCRGSKIIPHWKITMKWWLVGCRIPRRGRYDEEYWRRLCSHYLSLSAKGIYP